MKRFLQQLALATFGLTFSITALAMDGIGTRGGTPPAPNILIARFHVVDQADVFAATLSRLRAVAGQSLIDGKVCEYKEYRATLAADGPKFQHVAISFHSNSELTQAQEALNDLDDKVVERIVRGFSATCFFGGETPPAGGDSPRG